MRHRLHFSTGDYLRTIVLGFTILPFRLCGLLSCFIAAWVVASIGLIGADLSRPLVGWRAVARKLVAGLGRFSMLFCGFHWVQVTCLKTVTLCCRWRGGSAPGRRRLCLSWPLTGELGWGRSIIILCSSFFDAIVIFCSGFPIFVNREENRALPWIGRCMEFIQAIFVTREVHHHFSLLLSNT